MPINFPANPTDGQELIVGNGKLIFNSTKGIWKHYSTEAAAQSSGGSGGTAVYADMTALIAATGMSNGDQAFVTANNNLYIYSGSGWYKVATVQNDSPTAITGVSGSYSLAIDGTPTVITAVSTDPDGFPLTWTYSTSGLGSIATVSQIDNVFTITPSTTEADAGTFSLTINATDGVNGAVSTSTNLTLEFIIAVTNSRYTTLLATAVDTSDNNNITDASTNNHSITVNGDAQAGTFSPYRHGGYSTYFDGTGDWLELTGTALGNGNFTVEAWVWLDSLKDYNVIYDDRATGSSATGLALGVMSTGAPYLYTNNGFQITSSQTCTANTWHHISLVRSSGVITIYLDGTSGGTYSSSANFTDTNLGIGVARTYTVTSQFGGYIRDVRAVVGSAITPVSGGPTEPLTAVTNTSLLTCHLPYIADGSSNNHTITVNGNTSTKPFSPYDNLEYSAADHGGSVYCGASSSYLYAPTGEVALGSGDFTAEVWLYPNSVQSSSAGGGILDWRSAGNAFANIPVWNLTNSSGQLQMHWRHNAGAAALISSSSLVIFNTWNHCVIERSGTTITMYLNGKNVGSVTNNSDNLTVQRFRINDSQGLYTTFGYFSDTRITIGSAVYGSEFTPPTTPQSSSGTALHIKGTDASIIDKSQRSVLQLTGAVGTTTSVKFAGTKSIDFSTISNDYYVTIPSANNGGPGFPDLFSGPCTIECWINPQHTQLVNGLSHKIIWQFTSGSSIFYLQQWHTDELRMTVRSGGTTFFNEETTVKVAHSTWYHVCYMCNPSTSAALYLDGVKVYPTAFLQNTYGTQVANMSTGLLNTSSPDTQFTLGSSGPGTPWAGYVNDLRISNYNVYGSPATTSSFTPPTEPFLG